MSAKVLLCLATFALLYGVGYSIKCYVCNSLTDSACVDPFDKSSSAVKDFEKDNCSKCSKTKGEAGDVVTIARACGGFGDDGCQEESSGGVTAAVCTCSEDLCNGVEAKHASYFGILGIALTAVAFMHFY